MEEAGMKGRSSGLLERGFGMVCSGSGGYWFARGVGSGNLSERNSVMISGLF